MTEEKNESAEEPRIIVDEDWKSQVEREKEELKQQEQAGETQDAQSSEEHPMPPASFTVLLSTLATQAMVGLGMFPDPSTGNPTVNRPLAKHFIDTIAMLEEKTKGNLSSEEESQIRDSLHQLRMVYLSTDAQQTEEESPKKSAIELP